ncbi:MAG: DUF58 domain-containing protein [Planctomycetota bacterium]|nr:DUF58 domain-containing protein [Planctomycetota bacterium]MDA1179983.1 DUF58 domain-containing protein [Planctomycetota bacterium]
MNTAPLHSINPILTRDLMRRVREIQIHSGRQVADVLAGQYVSVFKGRGIEFDEVRPYTPGDDVRTIDWNVTARSGQPYVKRYVEERQLTLMLLADISASQDFGSDNRSKREATAEICALLAFAATHNDDKVGLVLFHDGIERYIPARKGKQHSLRIVREVLAHGAQLSARPVAARRRWWRPFRKPMITPRHGTHIAGAFEFLTRVMRRRAVCFVVSDFLDTARGPRGYLRALQMANRRHDVVAISVSDPREWELPSCGIVDMIDPETAMPISVDTSSIRVREAFARQNQHRLARLQDDLRTAGIDLVSIDIRQSIVEPLASFFRMRERRMRR